MRSLFKKPQKANKVHSIIKKLVFCFLTENIQVVIILVLIGCFSFFKKLKPLAIEITIEFIVTIFLLALGHTFIMLVGNIDLALPTIMALSGVLYFIGSRSLAPAFALFITILFVMTGTWLYGWMVSKLSINTLAFSLGLLFCLQYLTHFLFGYETIRQNNALNLIKGIDKLEIKLIFVVCAGIISFLFLKYSKWGLWLKAIGSKAEMFDLLIGRRISAIAFAYTCAGALAVLNAIIISAKVYGAQPAPDKDWLFYSIGATILGGVRLTGGKGSVWMALKGSILVGLIIQYFEYLNIHSEQKLVCFGGLIIIFLLLNEIIRRKIYNVYSIS